MTKSLIRVLSFFGKEVNEVRRQPRLVLSLLVGPFLILLLFGIGYQGNQPLLRTAVVLPPGGIGDVNRDTLVKAIGLNFKLVSVDADLETAMRRLRSGELDVVQILPADVQQRVMNGEQPPVEFRYNEINPLNEKWIQYLGYAEVVEINRAILLNTVKQLQQEAADTHQQLADVRAQLDRAQSGMSAAEQQNLKQSVQRLKGVSGALAVSPLLANPASAEQQQTKQDLQQLQSDLDTLDTALSQNRLAEQRDRLQATRDRIARLETATDKLSKLPPNTIVSPLNERYENLTNRSYDLVTFYAPGVLALLMHHIAVTLGSLSLVRDRLIGAVEIFRVSPATALQVLLGKYLGYTLFISIISLVLVGLMYALGIPFLGDPLTFIGIGLLLTLAALGIGFCISAWSSTDSQAVQLSMIVLLLSIFFSGFFLPLENFWAPIRIVGYVLPLTHGILGYQTIMLRGQTPYLWNWLALGVIAGVAFIVALALVWRQFRRG